jgi:glycosyltransferase involved in cell wall biosynthesis
VTARADRLVSVIIPVYNAEDYLEHCLRSVLGQFHRALEVIAVDDGSTDRSPQILQRFEAADSRLTVLSQPNGGVSAARNAGLDAARGEWVMFVDADDFLANGSVVGSVMRAAEPTVDSVLFREVGASQMPPAGTRSLSSDRLQQMLVDESFNLLWNKAYRREVVERNGCRFRPGIRMGEDLLFNVHFFRHTRAVAQIDLEGYVYRRDNAESATQKYLPDKYRDLKFVSDELFAWADAAGDSGLRSSAEYVRAKNVLSCIADLHHQGCPLSLREKLSLAESYKRAHPRADVEGIGLREWAVGRVYTLSDARALFSMTRIMKALR